MTVYEQCIYLLARLSPRCPTVDVRVADVCRDANTAVLLAGPTRALVATAQAEARRGTPAPAVSAPWVSATPAAAARRGLTGAEIDPFTGQAVDARSLRSRQLAVATGGGAVLGAVAGHAAAGMSRQDLKELGEHLDAGQAGLVVVAVSDMGAKVERAMKKAKKVEARQLKADTAGIEADARSAQGDTSPPGGGDAAG